MYVNVLFFRFLSILKLKYFHISVMSNYQITNYNIPPRYYFLTFGQ